MRAKIEELKLTDRGASVLAKAEGGARSEGGGIGGGGSIVDASTSAMCAAVDRRGGSSDARVADELTGEEDEEGMAVEALRAACPASILSWSFDNFFSGTAAFGGASTGVKGCNAAGVGKGVDIEIERLERGSRRESVVDLSSAIRNYPTRSTQNVNTRLSSCDLIPTPKHALEAVAIIRGERRRRERKGTRRRKSSLTIGSPFRSFFLVMLI